jgi:uncharacterized membrane protein YqjE
MAELRRESTRRVESDDYYLGRVMVSGPAVEEPQPSITNAVERVVTSSQQLVVDRIDLVILEAKDVLTRALQAGVAAGVAVAVFFCGWLCINATLAALFWETVSLPAILAGLAAINAGVGVVAILVARHLSAPRRKTEK